MAERPVVMLGLHPQAAEGQQAVTVVANQQGADPAEIRQSKIADDRIEFTLASPTGGNSMNFRGRFKDGVVVGSLVMIGQSAVIARLVPTDERTFARIPAMEPLPEVVELMKLQTSPVPDEDAALFLEKHPGSLMSRIVWLKQIETAIGGKKPTADIDQKIDGFVNFQKQWDERLALISEFEAVMSTTLTGYEPQWCLTRLDALEPRLKAETSLESLLTQVAGLKEMISRRTTLEALGSTDPAVRAEGIKGAMELKKTKLEFEPQVTSLLADACRESGQIDEAINLYGELVALPMQEKLLQNLWANESVKRVMPSERLAALWKEKHGSSDGLQAWLRKLYDERMLSFAADRTAARPKAEGPEAKDGNQTVLVELFTSARQPTAIAPEVATLGLEKTWPRSMVVVLRHHLHVPAQDPLTSEDCEARFFNFYRGDAVPLVLIDGAVGPPASGILHQSPALYQTLNTVVTERLKTTTTATIDLTVTRPDDDVIQIAARVSGIDLAQPGLKLRLAVAEDDIEWEAFNGIRRHSMVVRHYVGGDQGFAAVNGELKYEGQVKISTLREQLHTRLTDIEKNQGAEFGTIPLAFARLNVVAFVQNDTTKQVLQTVLAPALKAEGGPAAGAGQ